MVKEGSALSEFKVAVEGGGLTMNKEVDQATALAVVNLLMGGEAAGPKPPDESDENDGVGATPTRHRSTPSGTKSGKGKGKRRSGAGKGKSVGLDKDLSLRPKGKKSFQDFSDEKKPATHDDKVTAAVYWLSKVAGHKATAEAVNSCYKGASWKRPTDLRNTIAQVSSKKGWIDTEDSSDIKVTNSGEDRIEHELPVSSKK